MKARMRRKRNHRLFVGNLKNIYHSEDLGANGRKVLKCTLNKTRRYGLGYLAEAAYKWWSLVNTVINHPAA
jgi:hypothetical protein